MDGYSPKYGNFEVLTNPPNWEQLALDLCQELATLQHCAQNPAVAEVG